MSEWIASQRAENDLLDIYVYGVQAFGRRRAVDYLSDMERVLDLIADNPRMGRRVYAIRADVRRHEHRRHIILYEEAESGVTILAVVHARSIERLRI